MQKHECHDYSKPIFDVYSVETFGLADHLQQLLMLWLCHPAHMSLIYRGSSQGINPVAFHANCDKKGPTLTLLKSEHGKVFGGFTSV